MGRNPKFRPRHYRKRAVFGRLALPCHLLPEPAMSDDALGQILAMLTDIEHALTEVAQRLTPRMNN